MLWYLNADKGQKVSNAELSLYRRLNHAFRTQTSSSGHLLILVLMAFQHLKAVWWRGAPSAPLCPGHSGFEKQKNSKFPFPSPGLLLRCKLIFSSDVSLSNGMPLIYDKSWLAFCRVEGAQSYVFVNHSHWDDSPGLLDPGMQGDYLACVLSGCCRVWICRSEACDWTAGLAPHWGSGCSPGELQGWVEGGALQDRVTSARCRAHHHPLVPVHVVQSLCRVCL